MNMPRSIHQCFSENLYNDLGNVKSNCVPSMCVDLNCHAAWPVAYPMYGYVDYLCYNYNVHILLNTMGTNIIQFILHPGSRAMILVSNEMSPYTNIVILKEFWHFLPNFKTIFQLKYVNKCNWQKVHQIYYRS
jgi:hypothetical protein